jgi:hypothetical protein
MPTIRRKAYSGCHGFRPRSTPAAKDADMTDDPDPSDVDAKSSLLLVQMLVLALIEERVIDGEAFRRIADDALSTELDVDPAVRTQIILRLNSVIQDTYAAQPINTSSPDRDSVIRGVDIAGK